MARLATTSVLLAIATVAGAQSTEPSLEQLIREQAATIKALEARVAQLERGDEVSAADRHGSLPNWWAGWQRTFTGPKIAGHTNALAGVVGQVQHVAMPDGGPQALECYTYDDHPGGRTRLTYGCVSNVELAGAGRTDEVRSTGVIITGPADVGRVVLNGGYAIVTDPRARVEDVCALCPTWQGQFLSKRGVWLPDPQTNNYFAGTTTIDRLRFSNGWSLVVINDRLALIDANHLPRQVW